MLQNNEAAEASSTFVVRANIGFWEFIFLTALLTSIIAMSIDIMLPALPLIGEGLKVVDVNSRQLVIISFTLGFAIFQLFFGPITDRYGRRPILLGGMIVFIATSFSAPRPRIFKHSSSAGSFRASGLPLSASRLQRSCGIALLAMRWVGSCPSLSLPSWLSQSSHRLLVSSCQSILDGAGYSPGLARLAC